MILSILIKLTEDKIILTVNSLQVLGSFYSL